MHNIMYGSVYPAAIVAAKSAGYVFKIGCVYFVHCFKVFVFAHSCNLLFIYDSESLIRSDVSAVIAGLLI